MSSIQVILDNKGPLYPGTLLQGTVRCIFHSTTSVRAIKLRFYGKEHTQWDVKRNKSNTRYHGTHFFFQMEQKLFEPENHEMYSGTYTYPYKFLLPPNLPSPFEFPYGYTRYSLKGIIDIPLAIDPRDRVDLELISLLDISYIANEFKVPFHFNNHSSMGCCMMSSGTVEVEGQINKRVFLPGEMINVDVEVNNLSSDNINEISLKLIRCFVAHSEEPRHETKFINEDLLEEKRGRMGSHSQQEINFNIQIPLNVQIPNMTGCQLLEGLYRLEIYFVGSRCNSNVTLCEIQIGHIDGPSFYNNGAVAASAPVPPSSGYPHPKPKGYIENGAGGSGGFNPTAPIVSDYAEESAPPQYEDVMKKM